MQKRTTFSNTNIGVVVILPQLLLIFVFFYWPSMKSLYWSLTLERAFGGSDQFVGLRNFRDVFANEHYWSSVRITVVYALAMSSLSLAVSTFLALLADRRLRGFYLYRTGIFLPNAIPGVAVGLAFRFLLAPDTGIMSIVNKWSPGLWNPAVDGTQALILIIVAQSWKTISYNFVFLLAGLQSIPQSLIESAAMDGAGVFRRMRDVHLPLLTPSLFFVMAVNITDSFVDSFGIVSVTTGGGPARATMLMGYKIYLDGFQAKDFSLASAQSIILMIIVMIFTVAQFRILERNVHYR